MTQPGLLEELEVSTAPRPVITPTRRSLWHRVKRAVRVAWLRFEIDSAEEWIKDCAADGIFNTEHLRRLDLHLQAMRVQLAIAEAS